jgi:cold shock protein
MVMATGKVIRFDEVRGYGFIAPSNGGEDVFIHANEVTDRGLRVFPGTRVKFRVVEGDRGLKAYDVRIIEEDQPAQSTPDTEAEELASHNGSHPAEVVTTEPVAATEDELFEVFAEREFVQQITDLLLATMPQLTGTAILELRSSLVQFARKNGWVE